MRLAPAVALLALAGVGALLARAFVAMPRIGASTHAYGDAAVRASLDERHVANAVSAVVFDVRGLDTLGEELVLFAAAAGLLLIVREEKRERHEPVDGDGGTLLEVAWIALLPLLVLVGALIVVTGHLSPGGGFQGGVLLSTAWVLSYLAGRMRAYYAWTQEARLDVAKAIGAGGLAVLALAGVAAGTFFRAFLPLGSLHDLLSGGIVPAGNLLVGLAVAPAIALFVSDVIDEMRARRHARGDV